MSERWLSQGELALLIGKDAADMLCRRHGGLSLYIPASPDAGTDKAEELRRTIGRAALAVLCDAFGGTTIAVPNKRRAEPLKQDIMNLLDRGESCAEIARRTGVTERYVRALAKWARGPKQLSLLG